MGSSTDNTRSADYFAKRREVYYHKIDCSFEEEASSEYEPTATGLRPGINLSPEDFAKQREIYYLKLDRIFEEEALSVFEQAKKDHRYSITLEEGKQEPNNEKIREFLRLEERRQAIIDSTQERINVIDSMIELRQNDLTLWNYSGEGEAEGRP